MRTTIDLPADVHAITREMAHQQRKSLSRVVTELIRLALGPVGVPNPPAAAGLPTVRIGRPVTADDVRSLEDE